MAAPAPAVGFPGNFIDYLANGNLAQAAANIQTALSQSPQAGGFGGATRNSRTTATGAINTTETLIINIPLLPAVTLAAGSRIRALVHGTCTSSNADVSTFTLRAGILGTTADASVATAVVTSAGSGTAIAFEIAIDLTVRTLGATGTAAGSMRVTNTGVTGIAAVTNTIVPFTSSTFATTTATFFDLTYVSAAVTTTCTFQDASIEVDP